MVAAAIIALCVLVSIGALLQGRRLSDYDKWAAKDKTLWEVKAYGKKEDKKC